MTIKQKIRKLINQGKSYKDIWEWGCDKGDLQLVKYLYETKPSICKSNIEEGFTLSCYSGNLKLIKFFVENFNMTTDMYFEGIWAISNAYNMANSTKQFIYLYSKLIPDEIK